MSKKPKASKPRAISMTLLLKRASRDRSFFRRLMKDPDATLAREKLSVSADNLKKLEKMSKLIKKRIPIKLKAPKTSKVLKQLNVPLNGHWSPDWPYEWNVKRFGSTGIPGQIKLPKSLI